MKVGSLLAVMAAGGVVILLLLPPFALATSVSLADIQAALASPRFAPALILSVTTTAVSVVVIVGAGLPIAWWLATSTSKWVRAVEVVVDLPIVIPPAVVGVALLQTFGRRGLLGPALDAAGLSVPFTTSAVVLAQTTVAAPFFIQGAANAFRKVDLDLLVVARTLGATPLDAFIRIAVPVARPGLVAAATLAWARALGEFGATLLFAGNMTGRTQTMPLAIFSALEADVRLAVVYSLVLCGMGGGLLLALRWLGGRPAAESAPPGG